MTLLDALLLLAVVYLIVFVVARREKPPHVQNGEVITSKEYWEGR
jgi:purine nucleoside permease